MIFKRFRNAIYGDGLSHSSHGGGASTTHATPGFANIPTLSQMTILSSVVSTNLRYYHLILGVECLYYQQSHGMLKKH